MSGTDSSEHDGRVVPMPPAPDSIELRHLRAFVAVAEELNFSRAAARLFVSQPALSRQIRALERLVGCELLRRSTHQVELTLAGDALLDRARRLLNDVDDAIQTTQSVGGALENRAMRLWDGVSELQATEAGLQSLRDACESIHAQLPLPDVDVRPVNAGGVPAFIVAPEQGRAARMLFVHGGGYVMGSAFGYRHLAGALALAADTAVIVPEYRLAPEHPFPAAVEDAMRAYLWMLDSGIDVSEIVVAGDSAGGGLVLSLLILLKQRGLVMPGGSLLLCPGVDLTFTYERELPSEPQPAVTLDQLRSFAAAYLGGHPADDDVVNPIAADLSGLPPMLIQGGTGDVLVQDAHRLADNARAHGVEVTLQLYPVPTHDFQIFWSFLPEAAEAVEQAGRFARGIRASNAGAERLVP
jgi:monoterpene epsilon-lactone hydrolase